MSVERKLVDLTVAIEIENFLGGKTDGQALFQRLYGAAAEEPIPERLLALVRAECDAAEAAEPAAAEPAPTPAPGLGAAAS